MEKTPLFKLISLILLTLFSLIGCERPDPEVTIVASSDALAMPPTPLVTRSSNETLPPTPILQQSLNTALPTYLGTPSPDAPHAAGSSSEPFISHTVSAGETLGYLAQLYGSSIEELQITNQLDSTDLLYVGQVLQIPSQGQTTGPNFKIIPDSELVYGPAAKDFDVSGFVAQMNGYLASYGHEVEGLWLDGAAIVQLVADRHSVNPRLLLAVLEYRTGWVTQTAVTDDGYPLGYRQPNYDGLYFQLSWAANQLNWGFYGRSEGGMTSFLISDGTRLAFEPTINDGTAGVHTMLGAHDGATYASWQQDIGSDGLFATFSRLFGNPFAYTVDPLWPVAMAQPPMQLPWASGETWRFTGGPHGGWNTGSAWAALDFAPDGALQGCVATDAWVTAVADGLVVRSELGAVVVDLDGDGYAGTGWAVLHMHLATRDRIPVGTIVQAGDRLGHPSCEGGFSNALHVHLARTFNGRWVAADGPVPFVLGGWVSQGFGREYDGALVRGSSVIEACDGCRAQENTITAE
jgi:murein DD-endopeptidase MepM/ murein hydrolase activator NlpD